MWAVYILAFILGTAFGSFLNVVIYRFNTGRSVVFDRSSCASCAKPLRWFELVPVASFLVQGRKCRRCKSKISWQYPFVEVIMGLITAGLVWKFYPLVTNVQIFEFVYSLTVFAILIIILVYDFRHKIIPDSLVYSFTALAFVHYIITHLDAPAWQYPFILDFLAGPILFFFFYLMWRLSSGKWMGFGDAKLVAGIGLMLGFVAGINAVALGFWIGAVVSVALLFIQRLSRGKNKLTMKSEIPFAPFLIAGLAIQYFYNFDVIGLSQLFF